MDGNHFGDLDARRDDVLALPTHQRALHQSQMAAERRRRRGTHEPARTEAERWPGLVNTEQDHPQSEEQ